MGITSDSQRGRLRSAVHDRLGCARVPPRMLQLGVDDGEVPDSFLLCREKGQQGNTADHNPPCKQRGWCGFSALIVGVLFPLVLTTLARR